MPDVHKHRAFANERCTKTHVRRIQMFAAETQLVRGETPLSCFIFKILTFLWVEAV